MWDVVADINSIFTASEVTVYEAFKIFDKHERGHLSLQRFEHAIRHLLGRARLTKPQIYELFQFFDADNDETIDFDEFKKKFAEVGGQEEAMSWLSTFVDNCADALLTYDVALEKLFRDISIKRASLPSCRFWESRSPISALLHNKLYSFSVSLTQTRMGLWTTRSSWSCPVLTHS